MKQPTLVIGHYRDPIHPFSDSDMLVQELPNARVLQASSVLELRLTPERLTGEIVKFIDECWDGRPPRTPAGRRSSRRKPSANGKRTASPRRPA